MLWTCADFPQLSESSLADWFFCRHGSFGREHLHFCLQCVLVCSAVVFLVLGLISPTPEAGGGGGDAESITLI